MIGHQDKAHGLRVDAQDNVWICDESGATIEKISPEGKLLMTIGAKGHRGDWDEAKGQRLLWEPLDLTFAPNGDIYIGEGHANESPNDTDSDDPTNHIGAARVIHLDKNGKFIQQWYGNSVGQGKFSMVHGIAVDPSNGNVWLGDREQYRLVVYTGDDKFLKTIQMRNLMCKTTYIRATPALAASRRWSRLSSDCLTTAAQSAARALAQAASSCTLGKPRGRASASNIPGIP